MSASNTYEELIAFLNRFNATDFLSQFAMTYLFVPEDKFHSEIDDVHVHARHLEFATGYYATRPLPSEAERVDGGTLEEFIRLIDAYVAALNSKFLEDAISNAGGERSSSLTSARIHSLYVRGDAYPHQYRYLTRAVYSPHDQWFKNRLGFTIGDALRIAESIKSELNDRFQKSREEAKEAARRLIEEREHEWRAVGMTEDQALSSAAIQLFYGQSALLYRMSVQDVAESSRLAENVCAAFLSRLSQQPPYRNPLFTNTFTDADRALWDYNTAKERPFFTDGQSFWIFAPNALDEVLYSTFFFDLMADESYKSTFESSRAKVLEELSTSFLRRIFPAGDVYLNPRYLNGEEFADALVVYDAKVLIVQCKSKGLTLAAHRGENEAALKSDLQKAIRNAIAQACKGRKFLESSDQSSLLAESGEIVIKRSEINEVVLVAVTYMPLHSFATRIREVEDDLGMDHSEYPAWALPIGDLDIVTQICNSPAKLLHYIRRRLLLETGDKRIRADEMDLLAFYLDQGLWLKGGDMDEANLIGLSGYSPPIDQYVFNRYDREIEYSLPKVIRPQGFDELVVDIESLPSKYRTDCALVLLELSGETSKEVMRLIENTKERCIQRRDTVTSSAGNDDPAWGMSIVASPRELSDEESAQRAEGFGRVKKYARRLVKWVALGWREGSTKSVDVALWLDYPFEQSPETDELVKYLFGR
ncbi:hypothetical protein FTO74_16485 [Granulicella sp. WH15]|uniref:hypothetical protein n=1 Tax=Granulicella sp. WH15 TaxID=2602070 RepID=UPI0013677B34|nr:hypothetical protein [Granulicella sp. WH15]QHN04779.1 hypothetical protein FTO74_16485 [Granulicella sp. WH15]